MRNIIKIPTIALVTMIFLITSGCEKAMEYYPKGMGNTKNKTISQIVSMSEDYKLLKLSLSRTGLLDDLNSKGPFTVFAPDNKAFAAAGFPDAAAIAKIDKEVLKSILLYHVVGAKILAAQIPVADNTPVKTLNGKEIFVTRKNSKVCVNGVNVVMPDIIASNGVIHAIDRLLIPPTGNIVELASSNPDFSLLVEAVKWASTGDVNVAALLTGAGPLTVFAPTNKAFSDIGLGDVSKIKSIPPNTLTSILAYHVIQARVFSCNLVDGSSTGTINGQNLTISLNNGAKVIGNGNGGNPSNIIKTDFVATNGVVHAIDRVLLLK